MAMLITVLLKLGKGSGAIRVIIHIQDAILLWIRRNVTLFQHYNTIGVQFTILHYIKWNKYKCRHNWQIKLKVQSFPVRERILMHPHTSHHIHK